MVNNMPAVFSRQTNTLPAPDQAYLNESNVASILGITGAFAFAALVVVALRLYVRTCMLRFVGLDDWTIILAALMAAATFICLCGESSYGMGRHREWQQPWMFEPYFRWLFPHSLTVMLGVVLVKISIAFFLMRIMIGKSWKIFLWSSVAFLVCFALACSGTLIFQCTPVSASWDVRVRMQPGTRCFPNRTYSFIGLFNSVVNIITDIIFAVIPVPVVLKLQVNRRTKITLLVVLSLGFVACIAGIIKARLQVTVLQTPDSAFHNSFQIWYMLELCLGILAASLPTLKPLFAAVLDGTCSRVGTNSRSRRPDGGYNTGPSHSSRVRAVHGPNSFPEPSDSVHLGHCKKESRTKLTDADSMACSSDLEVGKFPYDVSVTRGSIGQDSDAWDALASASTRHGSQEKLHFPKNGILKRVELSRTSEIAR